LISNVKAKEVIIFVNRIDELADPVNEIPEIRAALKKTLRDKNGPTDPFIIFGSAYLANKALTDDVADMPKASVDSMTDYISMFSPGSMEQMDYRTRAWVLSGVPQLYSAIGDRIAQGPGDRVLARVRRRAANIIESMRSVQNLVSLKANSDKIVKVEVEQVEDMIRAFSQKAHKRLDATLDELFGNFVQRIDQANDRYTARALEALIKHLEANGEDTAWSYSADGLRSLMRTAYQVMSSRFRKQVSLVFDETSQDITHAISQAFDVSHENFKVAPPPMPELPAPVGLAQTIALDLNTSIWKRWWAKRKGYQAYASDFQVLIEAETETMLNDLKGQQIDDVRKIAQETMINFLEEQASLIIDICDRSQVKLEDLHDLFGVTSQDSLEKMFEILLDELNINDALEERE
jgi:AcrR family transcriptional regulator